MQLKRRLSFGRVLLMVLSGAIIAPKGFPVASSYYLNNRIPLKTLVPQIKRSPERPSNLHRNIQVLIKVAIFIDQPMLRHLRHSLRMNEQQIDTFLEAYISQVDAIFSSLRSDSVTRVHVALTQVHKEIERSISSDENDVLGDIDTLLSDFCLHQASERKRRPKRSWDLALLLTSRDLFSSEEAKASSMNDSLTTMGISPINGIEWPDSSCLLVEFGVGYEADRLDDSREHRVYKTRGFGSAWVAAHELAHSLGIYHDGPPFNPECSPDKWLMSQTSYTNSTQRRWSSCSSKSLDSLNVDHLIPDGDTYIKQKKNLPGRLFDAQAQCRMYSHLLMASAVNTEDICGGNLVCIGPRGRLVPIGPALEGTKCLTRGYISGSCLNGSCIEDL